jgi:hypothetical protein
MRNPSARPQTQPGLAGEGYEKRDASAKWVIVIVVTLLLGGLCMHLILAGVVERLGKTPASTDPWSRAQIDQRKIPERETFPRLQISPSDDLRTLREREDTDLNTYGWVDRSRGVVRIPINRAMDLLLERGLPVRSETDRDESGPSNLELLQQRPAQTQREIQEQK